MELKPFENKIWLSSPTMHGDEIRYVQEAAELLCTLDSSVKREVYGTRVAEKAGITAEAMKLEVSKAFKRRIAREKKQQEKIDLAPAQALADTAHGQFLPGEVPQQPPNMVTPASRQGSRAWANSSGPMS